VVGQDNELRSFACQADGLTGILSRASSVTTTFYQRRLNSCATAYVSLQNELLLLFDVVNKDSFVISVSGLLAE